MFHTLPPVIRVIAVSASGGPLALCAVVGAEKDEEASFVIVFERWDENPGTVDSIAEQLS